MTRLTDPDDTRRRVRRRGRRHSGEGSIRQRPNGRYEVRIMLENGKRKSLYAKSEREALTKLREAQRQQDQGIDLTAPSWTVGGWLDHWLENVVRPYAEPTTVEVYRFSIRRYIRPHLGKYPLARLTTERLDKWQRDLEAHGIGRRTRQFAMQRLRTALNEAVARGHVLRNVATLAKAPKQHTRKYAAPNAENLERLRDAMHGERLEPLLLTALATGLRRGEVLGLTWEHVNLDGLAPTLTIDKRVNRIKGRLLVRDGAKTLAGQRTIPLAPLVVDALRRQRRQQLEERIAAGECWQGPDYTSGKPTGFVFLSKVGTVLEPRNVFRAFERVRAKAGLGGHTFHGLRHDFGSLLMEEGVPDKVVAELMGHANPAITRRVYQHGTDAMQRDAMTRLALTLARSG